MNKCKKCESTNIQRNSDNKYHDIFECLTCGNWTFQKIEDCCRNPYMVISQDHKFPAQTKLYEQCIYCGGCTNRKKPLSFLTHGNNCESEFDNYKFEAWRQERSEESRILAKEKKQFNYFDSPYYKYQLYLLSDEWKDKRKLTLRRDNSICQDCKIKRAEEVHHLTYNNLFHEQLEDLKSLCRECHAKAHGKTLPEFISKEHQPNIT